MTVSIKSNRPELNSCSEEPERYLSGIHQRLKTTVGKLKEINCTIDAMENLMVHQCKKDPKEKDCEPDCINELVWRVTSLTEEIASRLRAF